MLPASSPVRLRVGSRESESAAEKRLNDNVDEKPITSDSSEMPDSSIFSKVSRKAAKRDAAFSPPKGGNAVRHACFNAIAVEKTAYAKFREAIPGNRPQAELHESQLPNGYCEKFIGTLRGTKQIWSSAGPWPLIESALRRLRVDAVDMPFIIPVWVSSILPSSLLGEKDTEHQLEREKDFYNVLAAVRADDRNDQDRRPVIVIGLCDSDSESNMTVIFRRRVTEALPNVQIFIQDSIQLNLFEDLQFKALLEPENRSGASSKLMQRIVKLSADGSSFIGHAKLLDWSGHSEEAITHLEKRGFISPSLKHTNQSETTSAYHLINASSMGDVLTEVLHSSRAAEEALEKRGLFPHHVAQSVLQESKELQPWLSVFYYYDIFILPEALESSGSGTPQESPSSGPKGLVVPHSLIYKHLLEEEPEGYLKTEPVIIRSKNSPCISESQFYLLVALLIKHYPRAPRCYHHAARICIESHILELRLRSGVVFMSMLVQSKDESFVSTNTARVCHRVKDLLVNDGNAILREHRLMSDLQFGAVMKTHDSTLEFIDLLNQGFPSAKVFCDDGEEFRPATSIYLWFNSYGPQETLVEKHFAKLCEGMNAEKIWRHLIRQNLVTAKQYRDVTAGDRPLSSRRLLEMIAEKSETCDRVLLEALRATGHVVLAEIMSNENEVTTRSLEQSAEVRPPVTPPISASKNLQEDVNPGAFIGSRSVIVQDTQNHSDDRFAGNGYFGNSTQQSNLRRQQLLPLEQPEESGLLTRDSSKPRPTIADEIPAKRSPQKMPSEGGDRDGDPVVRPTYEAKYYHIERATDYFNERPLKHGGKRLGSGSFGVVYYGVLHSETGEKHEVAIKRFKNPSSLNLSQLELSKKQFGIELNILSRYIHPNVVSLLGFSCDGPELALIYEYMVNGALSHRLDCRDNSRPLPWKIRLSIALDISQALCFLHCGHRLPVIHRDVKSSNVLLTTDFRAKLSDFGLAVVGCANPEDTNPGPTAGTRPYMSPEAFEKVVTPKLDVYALGVILFELGTGLPPYSSKKKQDLKSYVEYIEHQGIDVAKLLDPKAKWPKKRETNDSSGLVLLDIGKRCTISDYTKRPSASEMVAMLDDLVSKA